MGDVHLGTRSGEASVLLPFVAPYDWHGIIAFFRARAIAGVETASEDRYARTIQDGERQAIVIVEPAGNGALKAKIRTNDVGTVAPITARLVRMFDLAADPESIRSHFARDRLLAPLVAARPGLRVPGTWDGFELAVRAILGQQITVKTARHLAGRIVERYGDRLTIPTPGLRDLTHVFPSPERLAAADPETLGVPRNRAKTLISVAAFFHSDPGSLDSYGNPLDCIRRLRAIPGIGEWTAQYIAMRALRDPDAFPADDVGIRRAMGLTGSASATRAILSRAEAWRPWRAYAAQHLWASLSG